MSTFTDNVRSLLAKNNTSINKMAKDIGIGGGTFRTWETENRIPTGDVLSKLASYFEVSVDYLLGNETESRTLDEQLKGIDFALHSESKELTDGEKRDVIRFMKFMKAKRNEE